MLEQIQCCQHDLYGGLRQNESANEASCILLVDYDVWLVCQGMTLVHVWVVLHFLRLSVRRFCLLTRRLDSILDTILRLLWLLDIDLQTVNAASRTSYT